jgi:hypothetical protein
MGPFDYLLTFAAIILALAVSDLVVSLHRLLGAGERVRWDWLAPLAALTAFLKILTQWWAWYQLRGQAGAITFELFVLLVASVAVLSLMASAALPDEAGGDLRGYFEQVSRRYFALLALNYPLVWLFLLGLRIRGEAPALPLLNPGNLVPFIALTLVFWRNRWAQGGFLALLCVLYVVQGFGRPLPQ